MPGRRHRGIEDEAAGMAPGRLGRTPAREPRAGRAAKSAGPHLARREAIARLLPVWPHEIEDAGETSRRKLLAKLAAALRAERRRGIAGHWSYDLARHAELLRLYRQE